LWQTWAVTNVILFIAMKITTVVMEFLLMIFPCMKEKWWGIHYIDVCMCRRVCMSNVNLIWRARSTNLLLPLLDDDDNDDDDAWKSSIVECNNV
jgi:hypothetical protein